LIRLRGICKTFAGVVANDHIDLDIYPAEIHALLGENGAGKSTLVKILYGFYGADSGGIELSGRPLVIRSPHDARAANIGLVFQDLALIPAFSVAENIALFLPDLDPVIDMQQVCSRLNALSEQYGLQVDPQQAGAALSIGEMQKVEILKLLMSNARVLILDEPTRVLAPHEVDSLLAVLRNLRSAGYAIVLITHKLNEVLACADRVTVLRRGRVSGTLLGKDATEAGLIDLMFEKGVASLEFELSGGSESETPVLELRGASTQTQGADTPLAELELEIRPGEIVGVAGVSGNGQKELADLLLGIQRCASGRKLLHGEDVSRESVRTLRDRGVRFIPENPLAMASIPFMSVLENFALTDSRLYARWGGMRLDWPAAERDLIASAEKLQFTIPIHAPARSLSGGNLQRMVIVRELARNPRLILASYLTRGLDVQSAQAARKALLQAHAEGCAILLISADLEELFSLSDRLLVLYGGRIVGSFRPAEPSVQAVGHLMTGSGV
jgi:simple sugar transport system ATP-binding protein